MRVLTSLSIDNTDPEALRFYHEELGATVVVHLGDSVPSPNPPACCEADSPPLDLPLMDSLLPAALLSAAIDESHPIRISTSTSEEGERLFCALSAEGSITVSEEPLFTSTDLGTLVDKFGTRWDCYSDDIV